MKKLLGVLVSVLLVTSLVIFAATASFNFVFGTPDQLKESLARSGLYHNLADNLASEGLQTAEEKGVDLPEDEIRSAAAQAFTPALLQESTENITEGIYTWLEGRSEQPDFRIDLTEAKQNFAVSLGKASSERIAELRPCTIEDLSQLESQQPEALLTLQCRPPGFNQAQAEQQIAQIVVDSKDFLGEPVITAEALPRNQQGQTVFEQLSEAPDTFQALQNAAPALIVVALLLLAVLLLLQRTKLLGLRNIGIVLVISGVLIGIIQLIIRKVAVIPDRAFNDNQALQPATQGIIQSLSGAYAASMWNYGIIFLILGVLLIVSYVFLRRRGRGNKPTGHVL
ncbi:hypothetical protein BH23PAT1_BH23PAT1_0370 [soil metagenome]